MTIKYEISYTNIYDSEIKAQYHDTMVKALAIAILLDSRHDYEVLSVVKVSCND